MTTPHSDDGPPPPVPPGDDTPGPSPERPERRDDDAAVDRPPLPSESGPVSSAPADGPTGEPPAQPVSGSGGDEAAIEPTTELPPDASDEVAAAVSIEQAQAHQQGWLKRAAALPDDAALHKMWSVFEDGMRCLLLTNHAEGEPKDQMVRELERLSSGPLADAASTHAADVSRHADSLVSWLETRCFRILGSSSDDSSRTVDRLEPLQVQMDLLRPLLAGLSGLPWNPFQELLVQIEGLEREVRRRQIDKKKGPLDETLQSVRGVRADALTRHAHAYVKAVDRQLDKPLPGEDDAADAADLLWHVAGTAERHLTEMHHAGEHVAAIGDQLAPLEDAVGRLTARLAEVLDVMSLENRMVWLRSHATGLRDWASEILTDAEDLSVPAAVYAFERAYCRLDMFMELWPERRGAVKKELKQIKRQRKKLFNEWVEKTVAHRLERKFGWRFVWVLENTILLLILAVVGLLIFETVQNYDHHDEAQFYGPILILALVDLGVCVIFLFEFFLKLWYSPHKRNYFKRHWFFDLLPSIPFGILAWQLEAAVAAAAAADAVEAGGEAAAQTAEAAAAAQNMEYARLGRMLRLPRLVRYVRILRPVIRIGRILLFALRGMDRLVRRYGSVLNRDIMIFEAPPRQDARARLLDRAERLRRRVRQKIREYERALPVAVAAEKFEWQVHHAQQQAEMVAHLVTWSAESDPTSEPLEERHSVGEISEATRVIERGATASSDETATTTKSGRRAKVNLSAHAPRRRQVRIEHVVDTLVNIDADGIEEAMDPDFPRQIAKITRVCALPPFRWMPIFRAIALARRQASNDSDLAARVCHVLGQKLQWVNGMLTWVGDLNGVVTAPQFVDRIGSTLVQSTKRLAYRLLMFGAAFLMLLLVLDLAGVGHIDETDLAIAARYDTDPDEKQLALWLEQYPGADVGGRLEPKHDEEGNPVLDDHDEPVMVDAGPDGKLSKGEAVGYAISHLPEPSVHPLASLLATLKKFVAEPVLLVGGLSLLLMLLGRWLQRVASQATDFYTRAAEAQFINLMSDVKQARAVQDHALLDRRVLRPEALVQGLADSDPSVSTDMAASGNSVGGADETPVETPNESRRRSVSGLLDAPRLFRRALNRTFGKSDEALHGSLPERVYLLYRDYLTGTPLHRSDNRSTNQLLGNLGVMEIRNRILKLSVKEQRAFDALDLDNSAGALTGPSLWFNFITLAVAQRTAQLVVDYNDNVIPKEEITARPKDERFRYELWRKRKKRDFGWEDDPASYEFPPDTDPKLAGENDSYSTTVFNAIDFLTNDPRRQQDIRTRFGDDVARFVETDRQRTVREIFGMLPWHDRPESWRAFNPYQLYWQFAGGGKIVLLPLVSLYMVGKVGWALSKWFLRTVRELLNPTLKQVTYDPGAASFYVAVRKIHRMRKPVFLAATRLRALMDVEYIGLLLPGEEESGLEGGTLESDLDLIGASVVEREPFEKISAERRAALEEFATMCERMGITREALEQRLAAIPDYPHTRREVLRALATAYVTDFSNLRTLVSAEFKLERLTREAYALRGRIPGRGTFSAPLFWFAHHVLAQPFKLLGWGRRDRKDFKVWWRQHCARIERSGDNHDLASKRARRRIRSWWRSNVDNMRGDLRLAAKYPDGSTLGAAEHIIDHIIGNPHTWTEHLVTLRTIQSLTILDVLSDCRLVLSLGEFEDTDEVRYPVVVPTL